MLFRISLKRSFAKNDWKKRNLQRVTTSDTLKVAVVRRMPFRISLKNLTMSFKKSHWKHVLEKTCESDKLKVAVVKRVPFRISLQKSPWKYVLEKPCESDNLKVAVVRRVPCRISLQNYQNMWSDKLKVAVMWRVLFRISLEERFETTGWKWQTKGSSRKTHAL